jgi:hypothetical protein
MSMKSPYDAILEIAAIVGIPDLSGPFNYDLLVDRVRQQFDVPPPPAEVAKKKILLVVPTFQSVYGQPFLNFLGMCIVAGAKEGHRYEFAVHVPERSLIHSLMNGVGHIVLDHGFDAVIVFDDDCGPPLHAIPILMRRMEQGHPIVLGVGFMRNHPYTTTLGRYFKEGVSVVTNTKTGVVELTGFEWIENFKEGDAVDDLVDVDFGGFPVALFTREVFEKIPPPWFGTWINGGECTHDIYFAQKALKAGFTIKADMRLPCSHLAPMFWLTLQNREIARNAYNAMKQYEATAITKEPHAPDRP